MQSVRKGGLNLFILQIREINSHVHSRSIDTSVHCEKTNTDIRNRSWIASRSHFSQKVVGLRRGVHNPKWHLCRQLVSSLYRSCSRRSFLGGAFGQCKCRHHLVESGSIFVDQQKHFVLQLLRFHRPIAKISEFILPTSFPAGQVSYHPTERGAQRPH